MKSSHWQKINRIVVRKVWSNLAIEIRDIIAADALCLTETSKWFTAHCNVETNRLYEDANFSYNQPDTFKYSRH